MRSWEVYRHTDYTGSGHSLFQTGEHTQTDTQTNGRYQMHFLPASLSYADNKNEIYRKRFVLRIAHTGANSPGLKYYTHG